MSFFFSSLYISNMIHYVAKLKNKIFKLLYEGSLGLKPSAWVCRRKHDTLSVKNIYSASGHRWLGKRLSTVSGFCFSFLFSFRGDSFWMPDCCGSLLYYLRHQRLHVTPLCDRRIQPHILYKCPLVPGAN